jgi:chromosome segregation ATPase
MFDITTTLTSSIGYRRPFDMDAGFNNTGSSCRLMGSLSGLCNLGLEGNSVVIEPSDSKRETVQKSLDETDDVICQLRRAISDLQQQEPNLESEIKRTEYELGKRRFEIMASTTSLGIYDPAAAEKHRVANEACEKTAASACAVHDQPLLKIESTADQVLTLQAELKRLVDGVQTLAEQRAKRKALEAAHASIMVDLNSFLERNASDN